MVEHDEGRGRGPIRAGGATDVDTTTMGPTGRALVLRHDLRPVTSATAIFAVRIRYAAARALTLCEDIISRGADRSDVE
jgi:hypothetical protein